MGVYRVNGPNGELYEVTAPDGATQEQIVAFAQSQAKPKAPKRTAVDDVTGFTSKVNRGLGVGDELAAAANVVGGLLTGRHRFGLDQPGNPLVNNANMLATAYRNELQGQRKTEDSYQAEHPHLAALATGTGNALTMAAPAGPGAQAFATGGRAINAVRGATVAGLSGAGYAAVDRGSLTERAQGAASAAHDPLTLGLGAVAGRLATPGKGLKPKAEPAPTLDELSTQRDAAYKAVDESGQRFRPAEFRGLLGGMAKAMDSEGFHAGLHPKSAQMLERLGQSARKSSGYAPTLTQLDQLRQQIGRDVAASPDAGERRMGAIMRDQIDSFIDSKGAQSDTLRTARDLHSRVSKIRSLDQLDVAAEDRAATTGSGGNVNNTTRQNVRRFRDNTRNLTPEERAAADKVVRGTPAGNALRLAGKLSPSGNGLMAAGHLAAVFPTHGTSALVGVGGVIAKKASEAITNRNVKALRDLIARGGKGAAREVSRQLADPQYAELRAQLASDLSVASGVQGAAQREPLRVR